MVIAVTEELVAVASQTVALGVVARMVKQLQVSRAAGSSSNPAIERCAQGGPMTGEPRGFSRVTAGFSSYVGELRLPLVLAQASPIFHSSCEGKLGIALE